MHIIIETVFETFQQAEETIAPILEAALLAGGFEIMDGELQVEVVTVSPGAPTFSEENSNWTPNGDRIQDFPNGEVEASGWQHHAPVEAWQYQAMPVVRAVTSVRIGGVDMPYVAGDVSVLFNIKSYQPTQ